MCTDVIWSILAGTELLPTFNRTGCEKARPDAELYNLRFLVHSDANLRFHFQKEVLDEDRCRAVSDEAKCLYTQEPDLFATGNKEYQGRLTPTPIPSRPHFSNK